MSALQRIERFRRHRLVVVPPDLAVGIGVAHDELVLGGAAGVLAGQRSKRAMRRQDCLAAGNGEFDKFRLEAVISHQAGGVQTTKVDSSRRVAYSQILTHVGFLFVLARDRFKFRRTIGSGILKNNK
jgi:hypothetical protein